MKKIIVTLVFASLIFGAFAQEENAVAQNKPRNQFVGCAVNSWINSDVDYWKFQITPKYGYHISKLLALGISGDFAHTQLSDTVDSNLYGINPFVRFKYLCKETNSAPIVLFADLGVNYSITKYSDERADGKDAYFGLRPGIAYIMSNRFSIAAYFGFIGYRYSNAPKADNNGTGFSLTTNGLALGLNIHF